MTRLTREDLPEFPHVFTAVRRSGFLTEGGTTTAPHVERGRCRFCGRQYLGPHDLLTTCRERMRRALADVS